MEGPGTTGSTTRAVGPDEVSISGWWIDPRGTTACLDDIEDQTFSRHLVWARCWLTSLGQNCEPPIEAAKALGCIRVSNLGIGGSGLFFDYDPHTVTHQALSAAARLLASTSREFELWIIGDGGDFEGRIVTDRPSTAAGFLVAAARAARRAEVDTSDPEPGAAMRR